MKSAGKARNNGLYRHIRTSKEIIRNLLNDSNKKENSMIFPIDRKEEIWYILSREMKVLRHWKIT